jgi:hypothetical protein
MITPIGDGWHVITHEDLDDPTEPRTNALRHRLRGVRPKNVDEAIAQIQALLRGHGENGDPPVCIHRNHFPTVSSSLLALGGLGPSRYLHAAGPPCVTPYEDFSALLA